MTKPVADQPNKGARAVEMRQKTGIVERFTLIELLVVIAIISILASLLLPTLSKAKDRGETVKQRPRHPMSASGR